jgi:hypothetical protein
MVLGSAIAIVGALHAAMQPDSAWHGADQNKILWVALQLGGLLIFFVPGVLAALLYLLSVRSRVRRARLADQNLLSRSQTLR